MPAERRDSPSSSPNADPKQSPAAGRPSRSESLAGLLQGIRSEHSPSRILASAADDLIPVLGVAGVVVYRQSQDDGMALEVRSGSSLPEPLATALSSMVEKGDDDIEAACEAGNLLARLTRHDGATNGILGVWRSGADVAWTADERGFLDALAAEVGKANAVLGQPVVNPSDD